MDDVIAQLLGPDEDVDEAEDQSLTAEYDEGALDPLDALDALDSPYDDSTDGFDADAEGDDATETTDERVARLEQERDAILQERERLAQENERFNSERQMEAIRHAQLAWREREATVIQEASRKPDWQQSMQHVIGFYRGQIQQITEASQKLIAQAYSGQWIDQVTQQNGLTNEDRALLEGLPSDRVPMIAQALARKNQESQEKFSKIENEIQQLRRGQQSRRRTMTRADGASGSRAAQRSADYAAGSLEHIMAIREATQMINQGRRR